MIVGFVRPFLQWLRRKHSANVEFQRNLSWEWRNPCFMNNSGSLMKVAEQQKRTLIKVAEYGNLRGKRRCLGV